MIDQKFDSLLNDLHNQKNNLIKAVIEVQLLEEFLNIIERNDFNKKLETKEDVIDYLRVALKIKKDWRDCLYNLIKK